MKKITLGLIALALSYTTITFANEFVSKAAADAQAYIISPKNGETVSQQFKVQFGLSGMGIAPAGIKKEKTGHHHLLIDTDIKTVDLSKPLPATDKIKHFGGGQTETTLQLPPGK
ncbi:MAG: rod shape-determining protein RodA, partial [Methylophilaceae bacterium]